MKRISLLFILFGCLFAQKSIVLLRFSSVNVDTVIPQVAMELFRSELTSAGYNVITDTNTCSEISCAGEVARQKRTSLALFGSLIGMGDKIVMTAYFVRNDDEIQYTDRITGEYVEDIDAMVKRICDGFYTGKPVSESATVDNITLGETYEPRRRKEFYTLGSRIGFFFPVNASVAEGSSLFGYEIIAMYETQNWMVELMSGYHGFDENESFIPIDISIFKLLSENDFCPYIGIGSGVHLLYQDIEDRDYDIIDGDTVYYPVFDEETHQLPIITAGGGLLLFRTYSFRVSVDIRGWVGVSKPYYHGINLTFGLTRRATHGDIGCCWGF
ncbi:hypothetical protein DRQ33_02640 [bacterium]|nr:MAG: hypothetical protein DRQ33_02640 [bacterium]